MATRAEIEAIIKLKDELSAKLKTIGKEIDGLGGKTGHTKTKLDSLTSSMGKGVLQAVGLGAAIGGAAGAVTLIASAVGDGIKSFMAFESSMVRLETLVGLSRGEVAAFTDDIKRLSLETGRPQIELAEAMFQITSAGLRGADAIDALTASAKGAAVGLGDALTIADTATSVVNAYGIENINASKAVDILLKAVREGKADPRELAGSLSSVIPVAAAMGIKFEEVSGLIAKLTKSGTGASEAATQMRGAMLSILSPSEQARKILEDVELSMDDVTAALNEGGLLGALQFLREHLSTDQLSKFIGRMEALGGVLSVTGEHFEDTTKIIASTTDALGAMDEAMARVEETAAHRAAKVKASWEDAKKSIGGAFTNFAFDMIGVFDSITEAANKFSAQVTDTTDIEVLSNLVRGVFSGGDIPRGATEAAQALGILDEHGVRTAEAMVLLREELDRLGVRGDSMGEVLEDIPRALEKGALSIEKLMGGLPPLDASLSGVADTTSEVEASARKMVEAQLAAAASLKPTTDELEKQKKAAEQHAAMLRKLADSLGTRGLSTEAKNTAAALKTLNAEGETLSKAGLKNANDLVAELVENGLPVPDLLADIAIQFGEINNIAAQTFPNLHAVNAEFLAMSQSIPIAGAEARKMARSMGAFGLPTANMGRGRAGASQLKSLQGIANKSLKEYNQSLRQTNELMQALGSFADTAFGKFLKNVMDARSGMLGIRAGLDQVREGLASNNFEGTFAGIVSGIQGAIQAFHALDEATSTGGAKESAFKGASTGAQIGGSLGGGYGAAAGAGIGALVGAIRGRGREKAIQDIYNEIGGISIDQAFLKKIKESGKHTQTFITEIFTEAFKEGVGDANRFAEEIGDLFSFLERGEISEGDVIKELKEAIPLLIEHFGELGETGQMEVQRIIDAAKLAGISIDELGALILLTLDNDEVLGIVDQLGVTQAAADALGVTLDQLRERVESIFAPETLESLAESFDKTTEEMRQILNDLGIEVQTDLERLAANAGLTVEDFQALGQALEDATGIPAEGLTEFLKQTGQTAAELAESLNVDITESLGSINDEAAQLPDELGLGADEAGRLADELERAARAASNINVGGFPTYTPDVSAAGGFSSPRLPDDLLIQAHRGEQVSIGQPGESGMSVSLSIGNITVGSGGGNPREIARQIAEELAVSLERGTSPLRRPIQRIADGSA